MKIFEFKFDDTSEWIISDSKEKAKEFYSGLIGDDLEGFEIKEIPEKEWETHYLLDINEPEPDEDEEGYNEWDYSNGYKIAQTFKEYAQGYNGTTDIIATTEY